MSTRSERACMLCGVIQTYREFANHGCPNCESVLRFTDNDESFIRDCTSPSFEGLVSIGEPEESWVARWLRVDNFKPGLYAVKVNGKLPSDIVSSLYDQGIQYRPRDGSIVD
ncbi:hypothetical protein PACTADRAFT_50870 [Pachysolen tannophilus NRRL Y-2460]|uniref:Transcription elongation factor SPT4 n=1 Tax=Pachysolen tannophilus NRRL Y-2460 TaxID=669874 RepID=A0A1E4TTI0_PACTA|nr:hypothetical protein PACTADRAFT_50870 [Pachysolen tannophilus NRRL Y-2460]